MIYFYESVQLFTSVILLYEQGLSSGHVVCAVWYFIREVSGKNPQSWEVSNQWDAYMSVYKHVYVKYISII